MAKTALIVPLYAATLSFRRAKKDGAVDESLLLK
jgi:hypothetical protein